MVPAPELYWLAEAEDWREALRAVAAGGRGAWDEAVRLANTRLDFVRTNALDETVRRVFAGARAPNLPLVRLAVLGTSTLAHLHGGIRLGGLRRGLAIETYQNQYGQYRRELLDPDSALYRFRPTMVLFAFDAAYLARGAEAGQEPLEAAAVYRAAQEEIRTAWAQARAAFRCPVLQQTVLNVFPPVLGINTEHRLAGSRHRLIERLNAELRMVAEEEGVDLVALDARAAADGLFAWFDPLLWLRSRQEIASPAAPLYGDLVARLIAARMGRSRKCLVLDLDNTLWGGVIGDDGIEGIVLGQGSPLGEGYLAMQHYARELARRGVILAVCSKNEERVALEPFARHPEMLLKRSDIACFRANYDDKPANLRAIADELGIGLDALVFLDDSPFERALVRRVLPMVAVPEVPEEPALVPHCLADAGYFESMSVTPEDRARNAQYQENRRRSAARASASSLDSYLRDLGMVLSWRRFDRIGLPRIVQLINKTNQFNLTTRRYGEEDVLAVIADPDAFGLQLRLIDRFGDNGIIAVVIGRKENGADCRIDTWLMSCRVLGRGVEKATLPVIVAAAQRLGARRLIGEYLPTARNAMVRDHYRLLGFAPLGTGADGQSLAVLDLSGFVPAPIFILTKEEHDREGGGNIQSADQYFP